MPNYTRVPLRRSSPHKRNVAGCVITIERLRSLVDIFMFSQTRFISKASRQERTARRTAHRATCVINTAVSIEHRRDGSLIGNVSRCVILSFTKHLINIEGRSEGIHHTPDLSSLVSHLHDRIVNFKPTPNRSVLELTALHPSYSPTSIIGHTIAPGASLQVNMNNFRPNYIQ